MIWLFLSRNGCSSALLPTHTAAASFFEKPVIHASAFSLLAWLYSQVPVLPAVSQPMFTFDAVTWLSAYVRSSLFCWLNTRGWSGRGSVSLYTRSLPFMTFS